MAKKKIEWEVSVETDKDLLENDNLYKKACENCRSGNRVIGKTCCDCILSKTKRNFKPLKKVKV